MFHSSVSSPRWSGEHSWWDRQPVTMITNIRVVFPNPCLLSTYFYEQTQCILSSHGEGDQSEDMALPPADWPPSESSRRVMCPALSGCHDCTMDGCIVFIQGDLGRLQVLGSHVISPMPGSTVDWDVGTRQPLSIARYFFSDIDSLVHQAPLHGEGISRNLVLWLFLLSLKADSSAGISKVLSDPPCRSKQIWSNIFQVTLESKWHRITFWSHFWNCSLIVLVIGLLPASLFWKRCLLVPIHEVVSQCCVCFISCL